MGPEAWTAFGVIGAAAITAGPAYLLARARGARQGAEQTQDAVAETVSMGLARIQGRLDAMQDQLSEVTRWQVSHTAEHITITPGPHRGAS